MKSSLLSGAFSLGYELIEFGARELFLVRGSFRFRSTFQKLFNSRTRNKCLARTHNFSDAASPDEIDNRQPGQASFTRSLNDINPFRGIKFFSLETNSFYPDVARSGHASRSARKAHDFSPRDINPSFEPACGQASPVYQFPNGLPGHTSGASSITLRHPFVSI
ncbi:MAG TPA: hypothetical protein VKV30_04040 [Candidatus Angelobacter sp.]|nr:hypothetical protein [Candidatus Angelobacter sp.]